MKHKLFIMALLVLLGTVCFAQNTPQSRVNLRAITSTQYTKRTELFAEFRPLLLNTAGRFTAHLTRLGKSFRALADAEVTVTLEIDGKMVWQGTSKAESPGIYRFPIKSEVTGTGKVTIEIKAPNFTDSFVVQGVTVFSTQAEALAEQKPMVQEKLITYTKEKSWETEFATAQINKGGRFIRIPKTALLSENGSNWVILQKDPEHFIRQAVKVEKISGTKAKISSGLSKGQRIVVLGGENVK